MRGLVLIFALMGMLSPPAWGEVVRVRSGEHADFSRLVFTFDRPTGWRIEPAPTGYSLILDRADMRFDFGRVFALIPRDRLAAIASPGPGQVRLDMAREAHIEGFEIAPARLVLDIYDGPPPDLPEAETPRDSIAALPDLPGAPSLPARAPLVPIGNRVEAPPAPEAAIAAAPTEAEEKRKAALQQALLDAFSRAASQGLIDPRIEPLPDLSGPPAPEMPPAPPRPPAPVAAPPTGPGLRIETAEDRARPGHDSGDAPPRPVTCLPDSALAISDWGEGLPPAALIADMRQGVVGEFDKVDLGALRRLVRGYLHLGFGAEAEAALASFGMPAEDAALLRAMARIIDDGDAGESDVFAGQLGCDGRAALWAALALRQLPPTAEIARGAVVASFSELPLHMRRHLGPVLARRFLEAGDHETAERIRNAIARAPGDAGAGLALIEADMALANHDPARAEAHLRPLVDEDGPAAAEALLTILEARIAGEMPTDPADILAAEALALEHRGTPLGARLARAAIIGTALAGDFPGAFDKVGRAPPAQARATWPELMGLLARQADDAVFLGHAFAALGHDLPAPLSDELKIALSGRFLALGFSVEANRVLPTEASGEPKALRLLRARIALAEGDPAQALNGIAGLSGPQVEALRGAAHAALGQAADATHHFARAGETEAAAEQAWEAGDWAVIARLGPPEQRAIATKALTAETAPDTPGPLAEARALLDQTAESRHLFEALLPEVAPALR